MEHLGTSFKIRSRIAVFAAGCLMVVPVRGASVETAYAHGLVLKLEPDTLSLALGEPVRVIATLYNRSDHALNIGAIKVLVHGDPTYICYLVEDPSGQKSVRSFEEMIVDGIGYDFEPLAPSATRKVLLYPNVTTRRISYVEQRTERTFSRVGTYRIRVGYTVRRAWEDLWHPPGDTLWSNTAVVHVREPTPQEREIYEALWSGAGERSLARGDMTFGAFDENALERVIERYPENPAIRYALFASVRATSSPSRRWAHAQTVDVLNEIRRRWPRFRAPEVSNRRADMLVRLGRFREATVETDAGLRKWPWLRDNWGYMSVRIWAFVQGVGSQGDTLSDKFLQARKEGRPFRLADYPDMGAE